LCLLLSDIYLSEVGDSAGPAVEPRNGKRVFFPATLDGPLGAIDPHDPSSQKLSEPVSGSAEEPSALKSTRYLCAAISMLVKGGWYMAAVDASCRLWNMLTDSWVHAGHFAAACMAAPPARIQRDSVASASAALSPRLETSAEGAGAAGPAAVPEAHDMQAAVKATASALAAVMEFVSRVFQDDDIGGAEFFEDGQFPGQDLSAEKIGCGEDSCTQRESEEFLLSLRGLALFFTNVIWVFRDWKCVVEVGHRFIIIYSRKAPLDVSRTMMQSMFSLVLYAQTQLSKSALEVKNSKQSTLDKFVGDWEEAQAKKRKKKARIARIEKDEDEVAFDLARGKLQEDVDGAAAAHQIEQSRLDGFESDMKKILGAQPVGIQLLDRVRKKTKEFLINCSTFMPASEQSAAADVLKSDPMGIRPFVTEMSASSLVYSNLIDGNQSLERAFDGIQREFNDTGNFLREKKDILTILEAMGEQGDLLLLFGKVSDARRVWNDAIDSVFHCIDAVKQWQKLLKDAKSKGSSDKGLALFALPCVSILGKLSKFCCSDDLDMKSDYCRLAAAIMPFAFSESLGHPQTPSGFSAYECYEIGGIGFLNCHAPRLSLPSLTASLEEISAVLDGEEEFLAALPAVVLLEHIHYCYTRRPDFWMKARLLRIRLLTQLSFFSEAASMLSGLQFGIEAVASKKSGNVMAEFDLYRRMAPFKDKARSEFDVRENNYDYFGYSPYWSNLPPHHESNLLALKWILDLPAAITGLASTSAALQVSVPLSEEEKASAARAAEAAAAAAAADPKGKIQKQASTKMEQLTKSQSNVEAATAPPGTISLISSNLLLQLSIECCNFVVSVTKVDLKIFSPNRAIILEQLGLCENKLGQALEAILSLQASPKPPNSTGSSLSSFWSDPQVVANFCQACGLLIALQLEHNRNLIAARASAMFLLKSISQGIDVATQSTNQCNYGVVLYLRKFWMGTVLQIAEISERQGRFADSISEVSSGAEEASKLCWGFWFRNFLAKRAKLMFKLGRIPESERDCDAVIDSFEYNYAVRWYPDCKLDLSGTRTRISLLLVRVLLQKASIIRIKSLCSQKAAAEKNTLQCISLVLQAYSMSEYLAQTHGFLGADGNMSELASAGKAADESTPLGAVSEHHLLPPALHALTGIHPNDPLLTMEPVAAKRRERSSSGETNISSDYIVARKSVLQQYDGGSFGFFHRPNLRRIRLNSSGKPDESHCKSEMANIYLPSVRYIAACTAALARLYPDSESIDGSELNTLLKQCWSEDNSSFFEDDQSENRAEISLRYYTMVTVEDSLKVNNLLSAFPSYLILSSSF
jgi:hypothetical protein